MVRGPAVSLNRLPTHTIGIILLVIGILGAIMSMIFWSSWGGFGGSRNDTTITER